MLGSPEVAAKLAGQGVTPFPTTSEQFTTVMRSESARNAKVVKAAGIKIE